MRRSIGRGTSLKAPPAAVAAHTRKVIRFIRYSSGVDVPRVRSSSHKSLSASNCSHTPVPGTEHRCPPYTSTRPFCTSPVYAASVPRIANAKYAPRRCSTCRMGRATRRHVSSTVS
eukprot:91647-Rhodomonas_salina.1